MPGICFASSSHTMFYILQCMICNFVQRHLVVSFSYIQCLHEISNTNLYIQHTYISQNIIATNMKSQNIYFPTLCPKGTRKPSNLHSSPKCWHDISITSKYTHLIYISQNIYNIPKYIFPHPVPEGHKETLQLTFFPQVLA